jgi:hypothetical protein
MNDRIGPTEARPAGFCWVILGQNPPEIPTGSAAILSPGTRRR